MSHPCPIVELSARLVPELREVIHHRAEEGRQKYGQYLSDNPRTPRQKAVHKLQEYMDALGYVLWEEEPDAEEVAILASLIRRTLARFPDLTFAEMTHKEGHSQRDYYARVQELTKQRERLLRGNVTPEDQGVLDAIGAVIAAITRQDIADRIRGRAESCLAALTGEVA